MITKQFKFENGDSVKEIITGFKGTITGTCFYITGCNQYLVTAKAKGSKSATAVWYDEERLVLTPEKRVVLDMEKKPPGCDMEAPNRG